jgi:hypothetical protein
MRESLNNTNPNLEEDFNLLKAKLELMEMAGIGIESNDHESFIFYTVRDAKHLLFRIMAGLDYLNKGEIEEYLNFQRDIEEANTNIRISKEKTKTEPEKVIAEQ